VKELRRTEAKKPPPKRAAPGKDAPKDQPDGGKGGGESGVVQATELLYDLYLQLAWASREHTLKLCETVKRHPPPFPTQLHARPHHSLSSPHASHLTNYCVRACDIEHVWSRSQAREAGKSGGSALPKLKDLMADTGARKSSSAHPNGLRKGSDLLELVQAGHAALAALPTHGGSGGGASAVVHFSHFGPAVPPAPTGKLSRSGSGRGEGEFSTAGGINLPKIVYCYGDDGRVHKQLVKGRDDLRGDAVMQQVFGLVNVLLARDDATRQRALRMRTYRIVPLAPTAGVVQWVDETMPLSNYLTGGQSAHERYRPHDWTHTKCRKVMHEVHTAIAEGKETRKSASLDMYRRVERHLKPVMHHFFLERWHAPAAWFEKRLAYATSVASGSMIGYVLGLGDRHSSNILLDTRSAELVHIDLGIAFDQVRRLEIARPDST
jgi:hypothetical protein